MENKKKQYIAVLVGVLFLLALVTMYFVLRSDSTTEVAKENPPTQKQSEKKANKKTGNHSFEEPENERAQNEQNKKPEKSESRETPLKKTKQKFLEAMKKARKTNCPLLVCIYNNSKISKATLKNMNHRKVRDARGRMVYIKVHADRYIEENASPPGKVHVDRLRQVPVLVLLEPWATGTWYLHAYRNTMKKGEKKFYKRYEKKHDRTFTLKHKNRSIEELVNKIGSHFEIKIRLHYRLRMNSGTSNRNITLNGEHMKLREVLERLRSETDYDFWLRGGTLVVSTDQNSIWNRKGEEDPGALTVRNMKLSPLAVLEARQLQTHSDKQLKSRLQKRKIDVNYDGKPLIEVIKDLENRTGEEIVLSDEVKKKNPSVSINIEKLSVRAVLGLILEMEGLDYSFSDGNILVYPKGEKVPEAGPDPIPVDRIVSFLQQHGCVEPNAVKDKKRIRIRKAINRLSHNGPESERREAKKYLRNLDKKYRSFLRIKIRETDDPEFRNRLGRLLSGYR